MGIEFNISVEPQGQPKNASELRSRKVDARETGNWQRLQERFQQTERTQEDKAKELKEGFGRQIQTVFRVDGDFAGYVSEDAITRLDGKATLASSPELDGIRSDSSLTEGQRAARLAERIGENLTQQFGGSLEIEHHAPGEGPTVADIRAEISDNFNSASELLEAKREKLGLSPGAFAEAFGEK